MISKYKFYLMWIIASIVLITIGVCKENEVEKSDSNLSYMHSNASREELNIVFISGIENGVCLVPNVNLWNKPGGLHIGTKIITTVKGCVGLPVRIIETKYVGPRVWHHVKTFGVNRGKSGWVTDSFIRK